MADDTNRTVFVGNKELSAYIGAVLTQLEEFDEVYVRARGQRHIGKACVVGEMMSDKYDKEIDIETRTDIKPDTKDAVTAVMVTVRKP